MSLVEYYFANPIIIIKIYMLLDVLYTGHLVFLYILNIFILKLLIIFYVFLFI